MFRKWSVLPVFREEIGLRRARRAGREDGSFLKAREHRRRARVVLRERRQAEDEFHRADHRRGGVKRAVHAAPLHVRADDEAAGAVGIDVVGAVLRVVLDHKNRHFLPKLAVRRGFNDASKREVVARDAGVGRERAGRRAARVIFTERHDCELRERAACLRVVQVVDPVFHEIHVAERKRIFPLPAIGRWHARGAFAVVAIRDAVAPAQIPDVAVRGHVHFLVAEKFSVPRVGENPSALIEVGRDRRVAPTVPVHAHFAVAVEIVEQDKIARELVMVGRDFFTVEREVRVAVAEGPSLRISQIAEHLVVGAVLLDDVEDVPDRARGADFRRDHAVVFRRGAHELSGAIRRVAAHLFGERGHLFRVRFFDARNRAIDHARDVGERRGAVEFHRRAVGAHEIVRAGLEALAVADEQRVVVRRHGERGGIPADRDEAVDDRDRLAVRPRLLAQRI